LKHTTDFQRIKKVKEFIKLKKILREKKYYKTNKVSCAHFGSWAAQGKAGGCFICNNNYYNYTLHNRRFSTRSATQKVSSWSFIEFGNLCSECYSELEKQCNYIFEKY